MVAHRTSGVVSTAAAYQLTLGPFPMGDFDFVSASTSSALAGASWFEAGSGGYVTIDHLFLATSTVTVTVVMMAQNSLLAGSSTTVDVVASWRSSPLTVYVRPSVCPSSLPVGQGRLCNVLLTASLFVGHLKRRLHVRVCTCGVYLHEALPS